MTNRACEEMSYGRCLKYTVKEYSFEDEDFRRSVNALGFVCDVGGRRFKICIDKPGLCRISYKKVCKLYVFCQDERQEEYLPASDYDFMLEADVRCYAEGEYGF